MGFFLEETLKDGNLDLPHSCGHRDRHKSLNPTGETLLQQSRGDLESRNYRSTETWQDALLSITDQTMTRLLVASRASRVELEERNAGADAV